MGAAAISEVSSDQTMVHLTLDRPWERLRLIGHFLKLSITSRPLKTGR
jgi:hypothetical protein